jgi:vacuolar-type H+-ATPase subunit I/STV1
MFKGIDRSPAISRLIENTSAGLAKKRGLPIIIGVFLVIVSFIVQLINLAFPSPTLDLIWTLTHHLGLVIALIGILLVEPLGQ